MALKFKEIFKVIKKDLAKKFRLVRNQIMNEIIKITLINFFIKKF